MKTVVKVRLGSNELPESLSLSPDAGAAAYPSLATPEHMQIINGLPSVRSIRKGLGPMSAENVYVRRAFIANDRPFKDGRRRLDPSALPEAARLVYDRPVQINHATDGSGDLPRGRWFRGMKLSDAEGTQWTAADYYLVADSENAILVGRVDGGAVAESSMSIEFSDYICSLDGLLIGECPHMPGDIYDGVTCYAIIKGLTDMEEASLCWAGMLDGTRMTIAAARDGGRFGPDDLDALLARRSPGARNWDRFWKSTAPNPWAGYMNEVGGAPAP